MGVIGEGTAVMGINIDIGHSQRTQHTYLPPNVAGGGGSRTVGRCRKSLIRYRKHTGNK